MGAHVSLYLGTARVRVRPHFCGRRRKEHAQQQRARSVPALGVRSGDYLLRVLELALDEIFDSFVEENSKQLSYIYAGERARGSDRIGRVSLCGKRFQCGDTQHESKNKRCACFLDAASRRARPLKGTTTTTTTCPPFLSRSSSLLYCLYVRHLKIRFIHRIFAVWPKHRSYFRPDLKPIRTLRCVFCA